MYASHKGFTNSLLDKDKFTVAGPLFGRIIIEGSRVFNKEIPWLKITCKITYNSMTMTYEQSNQEEDIDWLSTEKEHSMTAHAKQK